MQYTIVLKITEKGMKCIRKHAYVIARYTIKVHSAFVDAKTVFQEKVQNVKPIERLENDF